MLKLLKETRISLAEVAEEFGVSRSTPSHWADCGVGGHQLESFKIGGLRFTTVQALDRFIIAINKEREGQLPNVARAAR